MDLDREELDKDINLDKEVDLGSVRQALEDMGCEDMDCETCNIKDIGMCIKDIINYIKEFEYPMIRELMAKMIEVTSAATKAVEAIREASKPEKKDDSKRIYS